VSSAVLTAPDPWTPLARLWLAKTLLFDKSQRDEAELAVRSALQGPLPPADRHDALLVLAGTCFRTDFEESVRCVLEAQQIKARLTAEGVIEESPAKSEPEERAAEILPERSAGRPPAATAASRPEPIFGQADELLLDEVDIVPWGAVAFSAGHTLATAHAYGIVHGDLHAENVLFDFVTGTASFCRSVSVRSTEGHRPGADGQGFHHRGGEPWVRLGP